MSNHAAETCALFARPAAAKLAQEIESAGARVRRFPVRDAERIAVADEAEKLLERLSDFDWLIFADVHAVDFFLEILEERAVDVFDLDRMRHCAVGEAVADRLRFAQLHADVIPHRAEASAVVESVKEYAAQTDLVGLSFLVVKETSLDAAIGRALDESGAAVSELPVYRLQSGFKNEYTKLKTLLKGGAFNRFIVNDPADFVLLKSIFGEPPLTEIFAGVRVSAADPVTLQAAFENGLRRADLFRRPKIDRV